VSESFRVGWGSSAAGVSLLMLLAVSSGIVVPNRRVVVALTSQGRAVYRPKGRNILRSDDRPPIDD
jgi:hypothetical protein